MAIREVLKDGNPTLRKVCREVTKFDEKLWTLLDDMAETMISEDGVGLAAPQIGILRRIFVIDVGEGVWEFINPTIESFSGEQRGVEGCLSCPDVRGMVTRPNFVKVSAYDRHGKHFTLETSELGARAVFHENDHLDGGLFVDKCKKLVNMLDFDDIDDMYDALERE